MPVEDATDRLFLVFEPVAVALYCYNSGEHYHKPKHFTILDAGKTNVNITSYRIDQDGHIRVVDKFNNNDCGGMQVNEKFAQFLETIVHDPGFKQYVAVPDLQLQQQHKADLNKLIYGEFEQQKCIFGDEANDDQTFPAVMMIPNSFIRFYSCKLQATINSQYSDVAELDGSELTIEPQKMKEFFQPAIDQICHDVIDSLERIKDEVKKLETVCLIGEFGGYNLIKKVVQDKLQDRYGPELHVFVPIDHKMAVACGAIMFRRNPEIVWDVKVKTISEDNVITEFDTDTGALSTSQRTKLVSSSPSDQTSPTSTVDTLGKCSLCTWCMQTYTKILDCTK